jgi:DNA-binding beta-propeller fold protein YncE
VARGGVFNLVLNNPAVTVTGGQFYVAWQVNAASSAVPRFELARADPVTGAIEATHRFGDGSIGAPVTAAGWLWVTISAAQGESLLRLNPADLAVGAALPIGGGSRQDASSRGDQLAVAGGALWVADGSQLLRVLVPAAKVAAALLLPGAFSSGVAASADGSVLVVSEANSSGAGSVQRRDPVTGTLIASHAMTGVAAPGIGGVTGTGAWVSEATGMLGYVERFSTATMSPDPATDVGGTNGINARVADGAVWVTDQVGSGRNYCANPATGRVLARIPLPDPGQDYLLAVSDRYLYYQVPADDGFYLKRAQVPAACQL